ncbi:hypothetical protein [Bacillus cereus]|uniref:hypothetical protein n=1 Tax=Bacillus cereus TaxID=1396 RepID=UPI000BF59838|nr:hypothetical protein [Bacillus cereus]PFA06609.1 hypothetical protein CN382_25715 [Bacillus cereus]
MTTKTDKPKSKVLGAIDKARKEFGEGKYILTYDKSVGEWTASAKQAEKGNGGLEAYEKRNKLGKYGNVKRRLGEV